MVQIAKAKARPDPFGISRAAYISAAALSARVLISLLFIISGASKLFTPASTVDMFVSLGLPFPQLTLVLAISVELGGSALLVLGYRARLVAAGMVLFTITTALTAHSNFGDPNQFVHFFKNISIAGGLLAVVAFGAGGYSLDARRL